MKKAILLGIDDTIKIVIGTTVKTIPIADVNKKENQQFLDRLFVDFEVVTFETMSALTKDDFVASLTSLENDLSVEDEAPRPIAKAVVATPSQAKVVAKPVKKPSDGNIWLKSLTETTIILDDISTGNMDQRAGVSIPRPAIIYSNRAINISRLDPKQVEKSNCLRKLLRDGDLVRCTAEEAYALERKHETTKPISIYDDKAKAVGMAMGDGEGDSTGGPRSKPDMLELGSTGATQVMDLGEINESNTPMNEESGEELSIDDLLKGM